MITKAKAKKSPKKAVKKKSASDNDGRPTKYKKEYDDQAYRLTLLGAVDSELASFFKVEEQTINNWKIKHPNFFESINNGKDIANANVATSMYQKSIGYSHKEDKVFLHNGKPVIVETTKHYAPDTMAGSLFLRNRSKVPGAIGLGWEDKTKVEQQHRFAGLTDEELDAAIKQKERDLEASTKD